MILKGSVETCRFATKFVRGLSPKDSATTVALYGDLGSGKTTFVQGVAKELGIGGPITSPTFVIEKKYALKNQSFKNLVHVDAYRLKDSKEILTLGWKEMVKNPNNLIFVEWAERIEDVLPKDTHKLTFSYIDEHGREIEQL